MAGIHDDLFAAIDAAQRAGFDNINLDLMYGLPFQTTQSFSQTLDGIIEARPERLSVFNYAHLPERFKPQRRINEAEGRAHDKVLADGGDPDVTAALHPELKRAAKTAARALDIPVTGLDFIVPAADQPEYVIIEANERPGLANHEPQPTAERFIDLLFPKTAER